jgi:hypothetical protein
MTCPIQLNKEFAEALISLTSMMENQERIILPVDSTFSGKLSIKFKDGFVTLSSTPIICFDGKLSEKKELTQIMFKNNNAEESHKLLVEAYGNSRFLRRDAMKLINPTSPISGNGTLTTMVKKKLITKAGSAPQGGFYWKVVS